MSQGSGTKGVERPNQRPCWALVILALLVGGCGLLGRGGEPVMTESMTPQWYAQNAVILTDYLDTLPASQIGHPLSGILLSDGEHWLAGEVYLGSPADLPEGVNVRLLSQDGEVTAYIWLDPGAAPLDLTPCESGPQRGIRARRAGGGAYTWRTLKPDHGLVYTICPPANWLPKNLPLTSAPPPA